MLWACVFLSEGLEVGTAFFVLADYLLIYALWKVWATLRPNGPAMRSVGTCTILSYPSWRLDQDSRRALQEADAAGQQFASGNELNWSGFLRLSASPSPKLARRRSQ